MKKLSLLLFAVILLASCDKSTNQETPNVFVGDYWMKTITTMQYDKGSIESTTTESWSPVTIYEEEGKLFVQTDSYGAPDTDISSNAEHGYIIDYPDHPNYVPANKNVKGNIEPVEGPIVTKVFLKNGIIWTSRKGAYLKSLPIQVKSGSETVLNLCDFQPVEIGLTSADGILLAVVNADYQYGPMVKNGDIITWDVIMNIDAGVNSSISGEMESYDTMHKNTLYKR